MLPPTRPGTPYIHARMHPRALAHMEICDSGYFSTAAVASRKRQDATFYVHCLSCVETFIVMPGPLSLQFSNPRFPVECNKSKAIQVRSLKGKGARLQYNARTAYSVCWLSSQCLFLFVLIKTVSWSGKILNPCSGWGLEDTCSIPGS